MDVELTKSAKKSLAVIYKEYCKRLKAGQEKTQAIQFSPAPDGVKPDVLELKHAEMVKADMLGNIQLTDRAIIYMENKGIETLKEWLSFGAQLVP